MSDRKRHHSYESDSDSDDYIQWKIYNLKKRLVKKARLRNERAVSPSPSVSHQEIFSSTEPPTFSTPEPGTEPVPDFSDDDDNIPLSEVAASNVDASDPLVAEEGSSTLDASILALLGNEPAPSEALGPNIHPDLVTRWSFILNKGLNEESVNTLLKKYPPSGNCTLLKGPCVNPEIASVINEQVARRDSNLLNLQNQIGAALSALGQLATALVLEEGGAKHSYIELASDASRLLLDFHHKYSVIRRDLLMLNLRKDLKDTLSNVSADGLLFGQNLGERIRTSKDIEKTGLDLKPAHAPKSNQPFKQPSKKFSVNSYRPQRRLQKGPSRGGRQNKTSVPSQSFIQRPPVQKRTVDQDRRRRQETRINYRRSH